MLSVDRQNTIKQMLLSKDSVSILELCQLFEVSSETVRRDLDKICREDSRVVKVYGGAYRARLNQDPPYGIRESALQHEKRRIAGCCLPMISNNDCLMLDGSTTTLNLAQLIAQSELCLTVVTNALAVMNALADNENILIVNTGGSFNRNLRSFVGNAALETIGRYHADKAFVSCSGLSLEYGVTDNNEELALIRRSMLLNSTQHYLLVDSNKFGRCKTNKVVDVERFQAVITNKDPGQEWRCLFEEKGIALQIA